MYQIDLETLIKGLGTVKIRINEFFELLKQSAQSFLMKDMDKAVKRLITAVEKKEKYVFTEITT